MFDNGSNMRLTKFIKRKLSKATRHDYLALVLIIYLFVVTFVAASFLLKSPIAREPQLQKIYTIYIQVCDEYHGSPAMRDRQMEKCQEFETQLRGYLDEV